MKEEKNSEKGKLDFSKLTPRMQVEEVQFGKLYRKAFLCTDKLTESEYARNTSAED